MRRFRRKSLKSKEVLLLKYKKEILRELDVHYPDIGCTLDYETPWQLLVATILSAQCTDARVNIITKDLFAKYQTPESIAMADISEFEQDIKSAGFYHNKAKNIIAAMRVLHFELKDEMPSGLKELTSLPGVGRKTANVIRSHIFNEPSIVVDTHVKRISNRLGFTKETDPEKVELDLMKKLPKEHWIRWNLQLITLGREICRAQRPACEICFLKDYCKGVSK